MKGGGTSGRRLRRRVIRATGMLGSLSSWGWQAAPGWTVYTAALLMAGAITSVLYPVGLALVIDASLRHQPRGVLLPDGPYCRADQRGQRG